MHDGLILCGALVLALLADSVSLEALAGGTALLTLAALAFEGW